jgi:hypothetical protein
MAFGQKQVLVAPPQPGTSNLPYATSVPKGGLSGKFGGTTVYPPFVPVTVAVEDYYSWAIEAQTTKYQLMLIEAVESLKGLPGTGSTVDGTLSDIANKLNAINGNLYQIVSNYKTIEALLSKIETNEAATAASYRQSNNIALALSANKIQTNEFFKIYNGETPQLKSLTEIIKEKIKNALNFNTMIKTEGMVSQALEDTTQELQDYFKQMAKEFGITKYIQDKIDALKALVPDPKIISQYLQAKTVVNSDGYGP